MGGGVFCTVGLIKRRENPDKDSLLFMRTKVGMSCGHHWEGYWGDVCLEGPRWWEWQEGLPWSEPWFC